MWNIIYLWLEWSWNIIILYHQGSIHSWRGNWESGWAWRESHILYYRRNKFLHPWIQISSHGFLQFLCLQYSSKKIFVRATIEWEILFWKSWQGKIFPSGILAVFFLFSCQVLTKLMLHTKCTLNPWLPTSRNNYNVGFLIYSNIKRKWKCNTICEMLEQK